MTNWFLYNVPKAAEFTVVRAMSMKLFKIICQLRKETHDQRMLSGQVAAKCPYGFDEQWLQDVIWYRRMKGIEWLTSAGSGAAAVTVIVLEVFREHSLEELFEIAKVLGFKMGHQESESVRYFKEKAGEV